VNTIEKYLEVNHLDRYNVRELIESIDVSAYYKIDGKITQDVTITYKFVGCLEKLLGKTKNVA
jgi:hypothetical protein